MTSSFFPLLLIIHFLHHLSLCLKGSLLSSPPSLPFALLPQAILPFPSISLILFHPFSLGQLFLSLISSLTPQLCPGHGVPLDKPTNTPTNVFSRSIQG